MMKALKNIVATAVIAFCGLVLYFAIFNPGVVKVEYRETNNRDHQELRASFVENRSLDLMGEAIEAGFNLPRDLTLATEDCGQPNAFYNPAHTTISICYELVRAIYNDYRRYARSDAELATAVWSAVVFVMYHEVGHAMVDLHSLPITGREEDAVDQLATVVLLQAGPEGRDAALRGAEWFYQNSRRQRGRPQYWGEHSLDQQRYFNVICWVYGSDPVANAALLGRDWGLPRERAERCPSEYARMSAAWSELL